MTAAVPAPQPLPPDLGTRPGREERLATVPPLAASYARVLAAASRAMVLRRSPGPGGVPDLAHAADLRADDAARLTAFQRLVGAPASDALPAGYVHVLAFPLAVSLMVRADFPLPVLGMVHLTNRVVQARPLALGETLEVRAWARDLAAHRRGTQVDLVTEVGPAGGAPVWRGVSTYLARDVRLPGVGAAADVASTSDAPAGPHGPATARWDLPGDVGRRYAAVSGDRNPLHLSGLTARALGYPRAIAHGMYLASRALGEVEPGQGPAFAWDVTFGSPALLPGRVDVRVAPALAGWTCVGWDPRTSRRILAADVVPLAS